MPRYQKIHERLVGVAVLAALIAMSAVAAAAPSRHRVSLLPSTVLES